VEEKFRVIIREKSETTLIVKERMASAQFKSPLACHKICQCKNSDSIRSLYSFDFDSSMKGKLNDEWAKVKREKTGLNRMRVPIMTKERAVGTKQSQRHFL
jgi:hypothetical protein